MAMQYINYIKSKTRLATASKSETPILTEEDEKFLDHIISEETPPPLPARPSVLDLPIAGEPQGTDTQVALINDPENVPLPMSPPEVTEEPNLMDSQTSLPATKEKKARKTWSWMRRDSRDTKRQATAAGLDDIAQGLKHSSLTEGDSDAIDDPELKKEQEDMTIVLERLNLAAVNNRVFSISDETQDLLRQFNQIFKDLVRGVPTAYDDLEKLLTNGDRQLQKTFNSLPTFLQKLIEKLPENMTKIIGPEMMAAAAERASKSGINLEHAGKAAGAASKVGLQKMTLKELVGKPSAIAGMLRSIVAFLRARFPAFMGVNVLWSLAIFLLLIVFWYCHKRGKEVREGKEQEEIEEQIRKMEEEYRKEHPEETPASTIVPGDSHGEDSGVNPTETGHTTRTQV